MLLSSRRYQTMVIATYYIFITNMTKEETNLRLQRQRLVSQGKGTCRKMTSLSPFFVRKSLDSMGWLLHLQAAVKR